MNNSRKRFGQIAEEAMRAVQAGNHKNLSTPDDAVITGMNRLTAAAAGLPVDTRELKTFFKDDLQDFGTGAVSMQGIRKACEWFATTYPTGRNQQ